MCSHCGRLRRQLVDQIKLLWSTGCHAQCISKAELWSCGHNAHLVHESGNRFHRLAVLPKHSHLQIESFITYWNGIFRRVRRTAKRDY